MQLGLHSTRSAAVVLAAVLLGCSSAEDKGPAASAEPVALSDQEDAVCGMLVREQPAPRSQVVRSDGSRFFFCSIGDMLVHLAAPSPHGRTTATFVEAMDAQEDPGRAQTGVHPWVSAEDATYVVGVSRPGIMIMGEPVLTYATRSDAEQVAARHAGAEILDANGLREWWDAREAAR